MKIILIADFFVEDGILGGGELNNDEFVKIAASQGIEVKKINSHVITTSLINENIESKFVVANFLRLREECKNLLINKADYVIYEHDHKYLITRNPADFEDFKAPKDKIVNYEFYKNAKAVFGQSKFHCDIIKKNLQLDNIYNLSGNLWSSGSLEKIREFARKEKKNVYSVMESSIPHKNTIDALRFCKYKKYPYELIQSDIYYKFLEKLGSNKYLVFLPKTPETLSRIVVEARMMNVSVITNNLVGASFEPWFELKGDELIDIMLSKRNKITNNIIKILK